jgi:hypothetical protein
MKITLVLVFLFFVQLMNFKSTSHATAQNLANLITQEINRQLPNIKAAILADNKKNVINIGNSWIISLWIYLNSTYLSFSRRINKIKHLLKKLSKNYTNIH